MKFKVLLPALAAFGLLVAMVVLLATTLEVIEDQRDILAASDSKQSSVIAQALPVLEELREQKVPARRTAKRTRKVLAEADPLLNDLTTLAADLSDVMTEVKRLDVLEKVADSADLAPEIKMVLRESLSAQRRSLSATKRQLRVTRRSLEIQQKTSTIANETLTAVREALKHIRSIDRKTGGTITSR